MPTPVARLLSSSEASLMTTDPGVPAVVYVMRWFWLIWPVPMATTSTISTSVRSSTPASQLLVMSSTEVIRSVVVVLMGTSRSYRNEFVST